MNDTERIDSVKKNSSEESHILGGQQLVIAGIGVGEYCSRPRDLLGVYQLIRSTNLTGRDEILHPQSPLEGW